MRNYIIAIMLLGLGACSAVTGNQLRILELGPSGQLNPFVPSVKGGCIADAGDMKGTTIIYKNGDCSVTVNTAEVPKNGQ